MENLEKLLHTFEVQKEAKEKRRKYTPIEAVERIKGVRDFLSRCELEVRELAVIEGERILRGPDGVNSAQTVRDINTIIRTMERLISTLQDTSRSFVEKVDLKSLTTLVVENLFSEMRQGNEMPLVLQFAHRFTTGIRE